MDEHLVAAFEVVKEFKPDHIVVDAIEVATLTQHDAYFNAGFRSSTSAYC